MLTDFMHGTIQNRQPEHGYNYLHVSGDTICMQPLNKMHAWLLQIT